MFPDAKWLDALKLPIKAKVAIALACGVLFYLFKVGALSFGTLDSIVTTGLLIALVVFGVLVTVDGLAWLAHPLSDKRHVSLLAARRAARRKEREEQQEARQADVLARLDYLSREEIQYVASALERNTPTFYTYAYSPPVGMMQGKGLVWSTGGTHHQDRYPFCFQDFVWTELLNRRDEFLAKEQTFKEAEEAAKNVQRSPRSSRQL